MPSRWVAISIAAFWLLMMGLLVHRDVLPQWMHHQRFDPRSIWQEAAAAGPTRWAVTLDDRRVGWLETQWQQRPGDWRVFSSRAELTELPWAAAVGARDNRLRWESTFHLTLDGDLDHFDIELFLDENRPTLGVHGQVQDDLMRVAFRSAAFFHEEQFYYDPRSLRSLMTASLAPAERLPNLKVGQSWEDRVMNPLLSSTEVVRSEVISEQVITWRRDPVPTYVVEQVYRQMRGRCWAAHDGTVLRQEVPFGKTMLVLERE